MASRRLHDNGVIFLTEQIQYGRDCGVILIRYESESSISKFLQCSVDGA